MPPINSHMHADLCTAFQRIPNPKNSRWSLLLGLKELAVPIEIKGIEFTVGLKGAFQSWTKGPRMDWARYLWLRPDNPVLKLESLPGLQKSSGLTYMTHDEFLHDLVSHCQEFQRDQPDLSAWTNRRIALIKIAQNRVNPMPSDLIGAKYNYLLALLSAYGNYIASPADASMQSSSIVQGCLKSAAMAALSTILPEAKDWSCEANMMLPVTLSSVEDDKYKENSQKSLDIWGLNGTESALMVVAETTPTAKHLGFWTPLRKGSEGQHIPGAPRAFETIEGCAVFKADLPTFDGFGSTISLKWQTYMTEHFMHSMFISLPVLVQGDGIKPVAVLNINVSPPEVGKDAIWQAYHPERLRDAQNRASIFMHLAYFALLVSLRIENGNVGNYRIDSTVTGCQNLGEFLALPESVPDGK